MIRYRQWLQSLVSAPSGANANANMNMNAMADLDRSQPIITWWFLSQRTDVHSRRLIEVLACPSKDTFPRFRGLSEKM
jgi:hypothetical protein